LSYVRRFSLAFAQRSFAATEDEAGKLACFSTGPAIRNYTSNLISEIIGTFVLVIFYLAGPDVHIAAAADDAKIGLGSELYLLLF
jgi:glycerol uptake facilitator protein